MRLPMNWPERVLKHAMVLELLVLLVVVAAIYRMSVAFAQNYDQVIAELASDGVMTILINTLTVSGVAAALVVLIGYPIAYFIHRYVARPIRNAVLLLFLLPYISSYYFILLGWQSIWGNRGMVRQLLPEALADALAPMGYGYLALIGVMTLRYVPLGALLIHFRLRALSNSQSEVAHNLGLSAISSHIRIFLPWCAGVMMVVFVFTYVLASLDLMASSLAGGGQIQTLANLINDWQKANNTGVAMGLGVLYIAAVVVLMALCWRIFGVGRAPTSPERAEPSRRFGREAWVLGFVCIVVAVAEIALIGGVLRGAWPVGQAWSSLTNDSDVLPALKTSLIVSCWASVAGTALALVSALSKHLRQSLMHGSRLVSAGELVLLVPLIVPPILAGQVGGHLQNVFFSTGGSQWSLMVAYTLVYGSLAYFVISGSLGVLPANVYLVARNLDVGRAAYLGRIFLFALWPAIAAGALLIFAFSINDPILATYLGGADKLLGGLITEKQVSGVTSAFSLVIFCLPWFSLIVIVVLALVLSRMTRPRLLAPSR